MTILQIWLSVGLGASFAAWFVAGVKITAGFVKSIIESL